MTDEDTRLRQVADEIRQWWATPRFKRIQRPYTAEEVAALRGNLTLNTPSHFFSRKLHAMLTEAQQKGTFHHTFGALDPVQVTNLAKYLTTVYVSGWQCSSTASVTNEPGPDFADYPANTVPNKVDQLVRALLFHDRKQNHARSKMTQEQKTSTPKYDYLTPIIADADTGFGGLTSVMKLIKNMIDAGAAGIHMEDQRAGTKKCGHMGGKVLVACREHVARLTAVRLQADIMGSELNIVARTDALSAKLIDNNVDPVDQPFIIGAICPKDATKTGTFVESGAQAIRNKFTGSEQARKLEEWNVKAYEVGLEGARKLAASMGFEFYFDWEKTRTHEGFYPIQGSVKLCVARQKEFAKVADLLWMETPTPTVKTAREFAEGVKKYHPTVFLAYNLSPSFNWDAAGMTDKEIQDFQTELGKLGYVWQFITLAGFHANALATEKFAKDFKKRHMIAYVEKIQRKEGKHGVDQLLHQKWSGAELVDAQQMTVSRNSAINSTNEASTEHQFAQIGKPKL